MKIKLFEDFKSILIWPDSVVNNILLIFVSPIKAVQTDGFARHLTRSGGCIEQ